MQVINVASKLSRQPITQLFASTCNPRAPQEPLRADGTFRSETAAGRPQGDPQSSPSSPAPEQVPAPLVSQRRDSLPCTASTAVHAHECLLAITDEGLTAFELPSCALKAQAFRTKGATCMAWNAAGQAVAVAKPPTLRKLARYGVAMAAFKSHISHVMYQG